METLSLKKSTLQLFETTKQERTEFVNDIIDALNNGAIDPLQVHLQIKSMENIIDQLTNTDEKKNKNFTAAIRYRQLLLEASEKYGGKSFEFHNAKFETKETGTKYDYSNCGDTEYLELIAEKAALDAEIKAKEKFLQTVPTSGMDIRIGDELVTVYPPSKKSTTSISVTLK